MAQRNIDFGSFPDDPNADAIRTAFQKVQENFTELFSGLQDQAVISVNRTAGTGITVNSPTGNVIVSANIAQVRIQSSTLDLSTGSNASPASLAVINSGTVPFFINLPQSITGIGNITLSGTLTAANANITSQLNGSSANFTGNITTLNTITSNSAVANTLSIASSANIVGLLSVTGNANITANVNAGNINATAIITAANANITANVNANIINANFLYGDGSNLTNVSAVANTRIVNGTSYANISNVDGNLNIVITGNPTMVVAATGANITGTLGVSGNLTAGNLIGVLANGGTSNITNAGATGNVTTAVGGTARITATSTGANVAGTLGVSGNANVGNLGTAQVLASANVTAPQLISNVSTGTAPLVVTSTTQVANLNVATAGTAGSATTAGTVTTNAQPNITSVGTLTSLGVTGNVTAGNVYANSGTVGASLLTGTLTTASQPNITGVGTLTALGVNGNITAANITANTGVFTGNGSGLSALNASNLSTGTVPSARLTGSYAISVTSATTAGTVTTAAQPNITSVGTLSTLSVTGNVSAGNVSGTLLTGTLTTAAQPNITSVGTLGSLSVTNKVTAGQLQGDGGNISNIQGANVSGAVSSATSATTAGTVTTAAQPNITSVGTLSSLSVTGNATAGNVYANSGTIGASLLTGTITTNAQPNITSVGTLSSLSVSGNLSSGNANLGNAARANFFVGDGSLLTNIAVGAGSFIENGDSEVRVDANSNVRVSVAGTANVLTVTASGANIAGTANVSGNLSAGNISATSIAGNLTTAAQTNITSLGTLTGLNVNGTSNLGPNSNVIITGGVANAFLRTDGAGNLAWDTATLVPAQGSNTQVIFNDGGTVYAGSSSLTFNKTTNVLTVNGNISVGNISGSNSIVSNFVTGTLRTNAQPNITSVGTLTTLNVNDTVTAVAFTANTGIFTGNGSGLTALNASNLSTGTVSSDRLSGNYTINITGNSSFATTATSATTAGTVTTAAQPNITSVGTLTGLLVTGTVSAGNVSVPTGNITANLFSGNGANLTNLNGSNVTGQVANALVAGTVYTAAQPNITSVGTLTSLAVTGNVAAANFVGNLANGNSDVSIPAANGNINFDVAGTANVVVMTATGANVAGTINATGNANVGNLGTGRVIATGNISGTQLISNIATGTAPLVVTSTTQVANLNVATAGSATTAGTVTTAAQPNITSVGTLTTLGVNNTITAVAFTANTGVFTGNGSGLSAIAGANVTGTVSSATTAGTVTTAAQPNITSVGTLSSLSVTANVTAGNVYANSGTVGASLLTGTLTTAAQPNITSVGTLTGLGVNGNITAVNITANTGVFAGSGANLTTLNASNISSGTLAQARLANSSLTVNGTSISLGGSGTITANTTQTLTLGSFLTGTSFNGGTAVTAAVDATTTNTASKVVARDVNGSFSANIITATLSGSATSAGTATTAGTVTTAAQPNITSTGTLTSLTVSGNITAQSNVNMTGFVIRSVNAAVSAAGTNQGSATAITREMNVVSTVASGAGVILPTAVAGMVISITNTSANTLLVYPHSGGDINGAATNAAYSHSAGATLQYIAPTTTDWYTVGATYA